MENKPNRPAPLLRGAPNFRDLGGLRSVSGRRLRPGRLFRSGSLAQLDDADLAVLQALNLRLVCDLRSEGERRSHPSRWPQGSTPRALAFDVNEDLRAQQPQFVRQMMQDPSTAGARGLMLETYRRLPGACIGRLALLFDALAAEDGTPAVIHCTAGKDRTGFVCAMLLCALDVPIDVIHADYLLSMQYNDRAALDALVRQILQDTVGVCAAPPVLDVLNGVHRDYLAASFERIREDYGSVESYLAAAGLDRTLRQRLQYRLLEAG